MKQFKGFNIPEPEGYIFYSTNRNEYCHISCMSGNCDGRRCINCLFSRSCDIDLFNEWINIKNRSNKLERILNEK